MRVVISPVCVQSKTQTKTGKETIVYLAWLEGPAISALSNEVLELVLLIEALELLLNSSSSFSTSWSARLSGCNGDGVKIFIFCLLF